MPRITLKELQKQQRDHPQNKPPSFDFIVVGAGSSGCPLASRLSEDLSVTVLLVEAGPSKQEASFLESIYQSVPAACAKLQQHSRWCYDYYAESSTGDSSCQAIHTHTDSKHQRQSYWPRGKGVGGTSNINYMAYVRGHANDYNEWENKHGAKGWAWHYVEPIFTRMENASECPPRGICTNCHGFEGPLGISQKKPTNSLATDFVQSCKALGYPTGDYNCFCPTNPTRQSETKGVVGYFQQTVRQGTRCDVGRAYIDPLLQHSNKARPNLFVLTGAQCQQVLLESSNASNKGDNDRATTTAKGIQLKATNSSNNNESLLEVLSTREVILSAGALASPQILLQSGIGPSGTMVDLPQVGQHLQDHVFTCVRFSPKDGQGTTTSDIGSVNAAKAEGMFHALPNLIEMLLNFAGPLTSSAYDANLLYPSKPNLAYPDLQIGALVSPGDKTLLQNCMGIDMEAFGMEEQEVARNAEGLVLICTLLHPKSLGYMELASTDKNNNNTEANNYGIKIHHNYLTDPGNEDLKRSIQLMRTAFELVKKGPLADKMAELPLLPTDLCTKYNIDIHSKTLSSKDIPDAFLEEYIRRYATTLYHPVGTCRMAKDKNGGVVDHKLRVFGVANLRVADASIQPEIVSGNTNAGCIMIGERAADIIREEHVLRSNPHDLQEAVASYENRLFRNRCWMIFLCIVIISVATGASITSAILKYQDRGLWK